MLRLCGTNSWTKHCEIAKKLKTVEFVDMTQSLKIVRICPPLPYYYNVFLLFEQVKNSNKYKNIAFFPLPVFCL